MTNNFYCSLGISCLCSNFITIIIYSLQSTNVIYINRAREGVQTPYPPISPYP